MHTDRIQKIKTFLQETPEDSFLKHALALEYIKAGDDAEAGRLFAEIVAAQPDYVGSYYHLGKLLERNKQEAAAIKIYEQGMQRATMLGDTHTHNELRAALEALTL